MLERICCRALREYGHQNSEKANAFDNNSGEDFYAHRYLL
jgi:hypothetical protein